MAATLTSLDAVLKETWTQETLEKQIYDENPFLDEIEKTTKYKVGQQAQTPIHVSRNGGYTALPAAGGTLNAAGEQDLDQATWQYTHHNQQVKIQGSALDGTADNSVAIAEALDVEVSGALADLRRQLTRQAFSNGDALITPAGTTTASTTVNLQALGGQVALERGWLFVGAQVDIGTAADEDADVGGATITATSADDAATPTITIGTAVTTDSNDYVSMANSRSGTTSYEMNGLENIVADTGALGGINPSTVTQWAAYEDDSTTALTLAALLSANRKVKQRTGRSPDYALFSLDQQDKFYRLLQQQVRYSSDAAIGAGQSEQASWHGMKIQAHPDVKRQHVFLLSKKHLKIVAISKPYWQNAKTGGNILDWIQGEDAYGGKISYRINLITNRRNAHAALTTLTDVS